MKQQKTVYVDSEEDRELLGHIGNHSFSPEIIRLAKIGMKLDMMGVSSLMSGLQKAGYDEGEAIKMALQLVSGNSMAPQSVPVSEPMETSQKRPSFLR